jgi:hypothetical protein
MEIKPLLTIQLEAAYQRINAIFPESLTAKGVSEIDCDETSDNEEIGDESPMYTSRKSGQLSTC